MTKTEAVEIKLAEFVNEHKENLATLGLFFLQLLHHDGFSMGESSATYQFTFTKDIAGELKLGGGLYWLLTKLDDLDVPNLCDGARTPILRR